MIRARACGEKVNALCLGFRFFRRLTLAPPCGGQVGAAGPPRPTVLAVQFLLIGISDSLNIQH
jgi:hypothetical protein